MESIIFEVTGAEAGKEGEAARKSGSDKNKVPL